MNSPLKKEEILTKVCKQVDACLSYRQSYFDQIRKYEDMYLGKTLPALKGRFNIPIPILGGFVDTLLSKIDDKISTTFKNNREATYKTARKLTSAWQRDSAADNGNFNGADLDSKHFAIFSGFGFNELIPSKNPYKQELVAIDYWDAIFEPYGGSILDKHEFKGRMNVYLSKQQLIDGSKGGLYFSDEVSRLIKNQTEDQTKNIQQQREDRLNRQLAMGIDPRNNNFVGTSVYSLTKLITKDDYGNDFYVLFDYINKVLLRYEPIEDVFSSGLSPFTAWQTQRSPSSFLPRPVLAQIYPIAEAMRILLNNNFDNIQKRNWQQIAYDAKRVVNPRQLEFRPNGLVEVKVDKGENVKDAWGLIDTPDLSSVTINLVQWLDGFLGQKTGITPDSQGNSDEDKVAIYKGNMDQVADRFGLMNKFYTQAHIDIAKRWKSNLVDYMPSGGLSVKYTGQYGTYEEFLTKQEARENLDIIVSNDKTEEMISEEKSLKKRASLDMIQKDDVLKQRVSPDWLLRQVLAYGGYDDEEIRDAMSKDEGGNTELISEAMEACEKITNGKVAKINKGATTAFIRKILYYLQDNGDWLEDDVYNKIYRYAQDHIEIARQNAEMMVITQGVASKTEDANTGQNKILEGQNVEQGGLGANIPMGEGIGRTDIA